MLVVLALLGSADVLPNANVPPAPVCGTAFAGMGFAGATTAHCWAVGCCWQKYEAATLDCAWTGAIAPTINAPTAAAAIKILVIS
jgi:hypothetical protein